MAQKISYIYKIEYGYANWRAEPRFIYARNARIAKKFFKEYMLLSPAYWIVATKVGESVDIKTNNAQMFTDEEELEIKQVLQKGKIYAERRHV